MNANSKKPVNLDRETLERFEYLYPEIKQIFLNRCLKLALSDKEFFESVFFNKLFLEVK